MKTAVFPRVDIVHTTRTGCNVIEGEKVTHDLGQVTCWACVHALAEEHASRQRLPHVDTLMSQMASGRDVRFDSLIFSLAVRGGRLAKAIVENWCSRDTKNVANYWRRRCESVLVDERL